MAFRPPTAAVLAENLGPSTIASLVAESIFLYIVHQKTFAPLAKIPGLFLAGLTPLWSVYHMMRCGCYEVVRQCQKYGRNIS
jgi:hypothetical protein